MEIESETGNDESTENENECNKQLKLNHKTNDDVLSSVLEVEEYLTKNEVALLDYERQMFLDLIHSDGLVISGKGISTDRVITNLLKVYGDPANLILVINHSDWEEKFYKGKLDTKYVRDVANTAIERERVYLEGGIQFVSTRILVVDLLKNRVPVELITGVIVLRAHTIIESCQEAFALRLYRQKNKTGFIKAFSNSPEAFTIGYSGVERTMKNLFLKELFIWPRFHATIQASLKPYEAQTVEIHVPMTNKMTLIQMHILDIMNYLVKEIKRINRSIDLQEITVENCVTKKFHKILQAQLDCIWHQLNSQTKLIVSDLTVLRNIMISTMYSDSVSSYALVKQYRTTEYAHNNSGWTLLDAAENLFKVSKERVYKSDQEFEPELSPKWQFLTEIITVEIPSDVRKAKRSSTEPVKVLILCQNSRTCYQLNQYLTEGGERYLLFTAMKNDIPITKLSKTYKTLKRVDKDNSRPTDRIVMSQSKKPGPSKCTDVDLELITDNAEAVSGQEEELSQVLGKEEVIESDCFKESYILTMSQNVLENAPQSSEQDASENPCNESIFEPFPEVEDLNLTAIVNDQKQPVICIQCFKSSEEGSMALERTLFELNPQYIIMYHYNVTAIRQIETYEARLMRPPKNRLKVFFLIHARTVEEQSFLTTLRREKQAFELLIETKTKMVIPEYQDGRTDEAFILMKEHPEDKSVDTRKAGGQKPAVAESTSKIIVDMREFRSDLPCLIHKRGIEIVPVTITIGDYILTPNICVERKSISDLIGSLNSGRLYNQCVQMQRYYTKPILLIEFDQNKPFHLQGKYMLSGEFTSSNSDVLQKLQLLTLHFPKLRLIWSPSPYATAKIFEELKQGREEPDPKLAAAIGSDDSSVVDIEKFNHNIYDFMLRLPGITSKNIAQIMRKGGSLKELLQKSREELAELLDSKANANMLFDILHVAYQPEKSEETVNKSHVSRFKRGRGKRF